MFCEKVFLEILQNSQQNTCARVSFLIKWQAPPATSGGCFSNLLGKFLNIIDQTLRQIISGSYVTKNAQKQHFWLFLIKEANKNIPKKFLLENNITHQLKADGRRITLSQRCQILHFLMALVLVHLKYSMRFC